MIRQGVARASGWAQVAAALLLAAVGVRFAVSGMLFAIGERAPKLGETAPSALPTASSAPAPPPKPTGPTATLGAPLRLSLVVTAEQERSEVLVDGVQVGQTPYLGEVSCKAGELVRIQLLPPKGPPSSFERRCAPGTLRIGP